MLNINSEVDEMIRDLVGGLAWALEADGLSGWQVAEECDLYGEQLEWMGLNELCRAYGAAFPNGCPF